MKLIWNKTFRDSNATSRKCFFSGLNKNTENSPSDYFEIQQSNVTDTATKAVSGQVDHMLEEAGEKSEKNSTIKFPEGEKRNEFLEKFSQDPKFFEENGKEKFSQFMNEQLNSEELSENERNQFNTKLGFLYIEAQTKYSENIEKNKEALTNRKAVEEEFWKADEEFFSTATQAEVEEKFKEFLTENQENLSETEKESLNTNPKLFWKAQGENLKKMSKKMVNRPKVLKNIQNRAQAAFEQRLSELSQDPKFKSWSEKKLLEKFRDATQDINLMKLAPFLMDGIKKGFIEKGKKIVKEAQAEQLKILAEKEKDFLEKNEKLLDTEFTDFSEEKGILKLNFEDFEAQFDAAQKEKIKLKNVPRAFGEKMVAKFEKQKEAFAAKLETAKVKALKIKSIIESATEKAVKGEWKHLSLEEITEKTNAELKPLKFTEDMPPSLAKLLKERLIHSKQKAEAKIENREDKESNDKIPRTEMAAAWNKMNSNLSNYEQNFSSKSKLKAFFISEHFGDREADAKAYLKDHPNFAKAIEAKFASYSKEKKEADSTQNKEFQSVIGGISNATIKKAMEKSFASSKSYKEKQGWIKGLKDTYVPRYEKSLSNLRNIRDTIDGKKDNLQHSAKAQEIFATITSKKKSAQESWKKFDNNFFSPSELEKDLAADLKQLDQVESEWEKENLRMDTEISVIKIEDILHNTSPEDVANMKKDPSNIAKKITVRTEDLGVWKNVEPNFRNKVLDLHQQLNQTDKTAEKPSESLDAAMEQKIGAMTAEKIDPTKITSAGQFAKILGTSHNIKTSPAQWKNGGKEAFTAKFNELWPQHQERIKLADSMTATIGNMDTDWLKKKGADKIKTRQDFDRAIGNKNKIKMPEADWNQWGADKFYAKADELSDEFSVWQKENGEVGINDLRDLGYANQLDFKNVILKNTNNLNNKFDRLKTVLDSGKGTEKLLKGNEKNSLPFLLEMLDTISEADFDQLQKDLNNKDKPEEISAILTADNSRNTQVKKLMTTHVEEWNNFAGSQTAIANNLLGIEDDLDEDASDENIEDSQAIESFEAPITTEDNLEDSTEEISDEIDSDDQDPENVIEDTDTDAEEIQDIDESLDDANLDEEIHVDETDLEEDSEEIDADTEEINADAEEISDEVIKSTDSSEDNLESDAESVESADESVDKTSKETAESDLEEIETELVNEETLAEIKEHETLDAESAETEMQDMLAGFIAKINEKDAQKENTNVVQEDKESKVHFAEKHLINGMKLGDLISKSILYYELENRMEVIRNIQLTDTQKQISIENAAEVFDQITNKLFELESLTFLAVKMKKQSKKKIVLDLAGHLNEGTFTEELALKVKINE